MFQRNKQIQNDLLDKIGQALDISESQYLEVEKRYKAVATQLIKENSILSDYEPDVMPQGSFLLGTMIKPIMEDDELDIDLVCRLKRKHTNWAQYHLKQKVGDQIKQDKRYESMLDEEGKRCWTLIYAENTKFHMDILPAIVGEKHFSLLEKTFSDLSSQDVADLAIRITDKTLGNYHTDSIQNNWPLSNPFGYAAWFNDRKKVSTPFLEKVFSASMAPMPKFEKKKQPLQRVIQLLKRHRDIMFGGDEDKPISIIITTLAARAYNKETDIVDALSNILMNMRNQIVYKWNNKYRREIAWIQNPVNSEENFADKWPDSPQKEENFYTWLNKAIEDFNVLHSNDYTQIYRGLKNILDSRVVNEGFRESGLESSIDDRYLPSNFNQSLLSVTHREKPVWPIKLNENIEIHGTYKDGRKRINITPNISIPKFKDIYFTASTSIHRPFDVYWQVVNTGEEAITKKGLRGNIFHSKTLGKGGLTQKENSEYSGIHWIQCFIVKNGICVAKSYEFIVNIK